LLVPDPSSKGAASNEQLGAGNPQGVEMDPMMHGIQWWQTW